MSEHTPGPWVGKTPFISDSSGKTIATVEPFAAAEHANARLIAAAPDLLEALEELLAEADNPVGWEGHPHSDTTGFQFARDAVKKARA